MDLICPSSRKILIKAVGTLVALQPERTAARLDAAGLQLVEQAEQVLSSQSASTVLAAWLMWDASGRPTFDPRGARSHLAAEGTSERPVSAAGRADAREKPQP